MPQGPWDRAVVLQSFGLLKTGLPELCSWAQAARAAQRDSVEYNPEDVDEDALGEVAA